MTPRGLPPTLVVLSAHPNAPAMRALPLLLAGLLLVGLPLAAPLAAQDVDHTTVRPDPLTPQGENLQTPVAWTVRPDTPAPDLVVGADQETADIWFVNMTPGWHVTTGPAAIFYHPASTAEGTYTAHAKIHLFDPEGRREAFGLFVGGRDLATDAIAYDYFVIRNSGEFLIKRRTGAETSVLVPWTAHEAIATFGPETESSVPNVLAVEVTGDDVLFRVNGVEVARLPRAEVRTDGVVGLRINHALNVHVEDLRVTE